MESNNIKMEMSVEDMQRMYGALLQDSAESARQADKEYKLLEKRYSNIKKMGLAIIYGLISIIIALIIAITIIFSSMTIVVENGGESSIGTLNLSDEATINTLDNSDNHSTNTIETDSYNNYYNEKD